MKTMINAAIGLVILLIIALVSYAGFAMNRYINYKFSYESQVKEEIKKQVKEECLSK